MAAKAVVKTFIWSLIFVIFLQGCNTLRGMGQDIEEAGETIEDAAD